MASLSAEKLVLAQHEQKIILAEFNSAAQNRPSFSSIHEVYAVLLQEVDELWDEVKKKERVRNQVNVRTELRQIAAVALRALVDLDPH